MNTEKTHGRFWEAMRARFGSRWITEFGDKPTPPWITLLNGYKPQEVARALELMAEQKLAHPPTLPIFEALLKKAQVQRGTDGIDHVRGYWRSIVVNTAVRHCHLLRMLEWGDTDLSKLPPDVYRVVLRVCKELLDLSVETETKQGQRTPGIEQHLNVTLWNTLKIWRRDMDPAPAPLELTPNNEQEHAA